MAKTQTRQPVLLKPDGLTQREKEVLRHVRKLNRDDFWWIECLLMHLSQSSLTTPDARRALALARTDEGQRSSSFVTPESIGIFDEATAPVMSVLAKQFKAMNEDARVEALRLCLGVLKSFSAGRRAMGVPTGNAAAPSRVPLAKVIPLFPSGGRV